MKKAVFAALLIISWLNLVIADNNEDIFYEKCTSCHGQEIIFKKNYTVKQWKNVIKKMKKYGLKISYGEKQAVINFLKNRKSSHNEQ